MGTKKKKRVKSGKSSKSKDRSKGTSSPTWWLWNLMIAVLVSIPIIFWLGDLNKGAVTLLIAVCFICVSIVRKLTTLASARLGKARR